MVGPGLIANTYDLSVPGDPASCHASAKELRTLAQTLSKVHQHQTSDATTPDHTLGGETGDAFRKSAKQVAGPVADLQKACHTGAAALDQLGRDLTTLQHKIDHLKTVGVVPAPLLPFIVGNTMTRPLSLVNDDERTAWNKSVKLYEAALSYQNGAQKAFVDAIKGDYSSVSSLLFPAGTDTTGYTPTPPSPHKKHGPQVDPPAPTPAPTPTPTSTGGGDPSPGGGNPGTHLHPHGLPAAHHHVKHGEKLVASLDDGSKHDQKPITAAKHDQLEKHLTSLTRQSQSLQHRIDVMQQAIKADPTNADNPLLHQEVTYLNHQLQQHQTQIQTVTDQLNAPVTHPHHGVAHSGASFEQIDKPTHVEPGKTWQSASVLETKPADVAAPVAAATPPPTPTTAPTPTTPPAAGA